MKIGMKKFGSFLKKLREEKGFGLREFADKVGISAAYLTKIEQGRDPAPHSKKIEKMAEVLNVPSSDLFKKVKKGVRLPTTITGVYAESDINKEKFPEFAKTIKGKCLTRKQWDKLIKEAKELLESRFTDRDSQSNTSSRK